MFSQQKQPNSLIQQRFVYSFFKGVLEIVPAVCQCNKSELRKKWSSKSKQRCQPRYQIETAYGWIRSVCCSLL